MGKTLILACAALVILFVIFQTRVPEPALRRPDPGTFAVPREQAPHHAPVEGESGESLSGPPDLDYYYDMDPIRPCAGACLGTAFAIEPPGTWLTAQHVIKGCHNLYLSAHEAVPVDRVIGHPRADVSLLVTRPLAPTLGLDLARLRRQQDGFHIGYPAGQPGSVHALLLGRTNIRRGGHGAWQEPVIAWAEVRRAPARSGSLGGLSGGAVLNRRGAVIGVTVGEEPRRGRVVSAAPGSLVEIMGHAGIQPAGRGSAAVRPITPENFGGEGQRLRDRLTVAQVVCNGHS